MADLTLTRNPLEPWQRERHTLAAFGVCRGEIERPIDWLQDHYPDGCGGAVEFFVNGQPRELDDLDYLPVEGDHIALRVLPAEPVGLSTLVYIAVAIILTAASYALNMLIAKPKAPDFARAGDSETSPVYSVRSGQNTARLGEVVPVIYGNVLHTPDICAQPYRHYQATIDEYFDMLLCLGQGTFNVTQVIVGDSDSGGVLGNTIRYHIAEPSEHLNQIGNLSAVFPGPPFYENMISSVEVGEQLFVTAGYTVGYFRMGKSGQTGRNIFVDIAWPKGLYNLNNWNDTVSIHCEFNVHIVEADTDGNPVVGTEQVFFFDQATVSLRNPIRVSFEVDAGYNAMWLVKLERITQQFPSGFSQDVTEFVWTGLRMQVHTPGSTFYGDTTLMAVRIKASALNSGANNQIRVRIQRELQPLGAGSTVPTASPADAFVDILTNQVYGARRPLSEVDTAKLAALKTHWAIGGHAYGFNCVYTGKTTVWEALSDCLAVNAATPLPLGNLMSAVQDGIRDVRTAIYTEQNMTQGSFVLSYNFDKEGETDGVEVEFRNPDTWAPAYVRWPLDSEDPEKVVLFGCSDGTQAAEFARLSWQRRGGNRRTVVFDTEMEGLIPILGERAAVAHTLPRWGQSGFVVAVAGLSITLDRMLAWDDPSYTAPFVMIFRDEEGGTSAVVTVTRGATDDIAIMAADPWAGTSMTWALDLGAELTHFAFGDAVTAIKDFILTTLAPSEGNTVRVNGGYYDPTIYTSTYAFMGSPVP